MPRYWTDTLTHVEIGDAWVEECFGVEYDWNITRQPLWGFNDINWRTTTITRSIVQGRLFLNFVQLGYLWDFLWERNAKHKDRQTWAEHANQMKHLVDAWTHEEALAGSFASLGDTDTNAQTFVFTFPQVVDPSGTGSILPADYVATIPKSGQIKFTTGALRNKTFNYSSIGLKLKTTDPLTGQRSALPADSFALVISDSNNPAGTATTVTNAIQVQDTVEFIGAASPASGPAAMLQVMLDQYATNNITPVEARQFGVTGPTDTVIQNRQDTRIKPQEIFGTMRSIASAKYWPDANASVVTPVANKSVLSEDGWIEELNGIDLNIYYGNSIKETLKNIHFVGQSKRIMAEVPDSGRCVAEVYDFIASHIDNGARGLGV